VGGLTSRNEHQSLFSKVACELARCFQVQVAVKVPAWALYRSGHGGGDVAKGGYASSNEDWRCTQQQSSPWEHGPGCHVRCGG